jgi:hypothetical protein
MGGASCCNHAQRFLNFFGPKLEPKLELPCQEWTVASQYLRYDEDTGLIQQFATLVGADKFGKPQELEVETGMFRMSVDASLDDVVNQLMAFLEIDCRAAVDLIEESGMFDSEECRRYLS